ncbi:hypothetical protein BEE60_23250 [Klebsiella pneumoniae]|nr:hypothetical protein A7321_05290 [Klebsiella pneumoniae]ANN53913.1 hypothetical protein BAU11_20570 [Klebsiella pneumoniae]OFI12797.1 hypothetical protein BEE60_23250 [Klebsiella pneumoniae]
MIFLILFIIISLEKMYLKLLLLRILIIYNDCEIQMILHFVKRTKYQIIDYVIVALYKSYPPLMNKLFLM